MIIIYYYTIVNKNLWLAVQPADLLTSTMSNCLLGLAIWRIHWWLYIHKMWTSTTAVHDQVVKIIWIIWIIRFISEPNTKHQWKKPSVYPIPFLFREVVLNMGVSSYQTWGYPKNIQKWWFHPHFGDVSEPQTLKLPLMCQKNMTNGNQWQSMGLFKTSTSICWYRLL